MKIEFLAAVLFSLLPVFSQPNPTKRIPLIGTAERVYGDTILVKTRAEIITLYADPHTAVWYGKEYHDFSRVKAGDRVSLNAERLPGGRLRAISVWVNYTNFGAVITSRKGDAFEVLTYPDADTYSGYRKEKKLVQVDADTFFESGSKQDLTVDRYVWVVGLDRRNGEVQATRIGIVGMYDGNGKVLPITGPQK